MGEEEGRSKANRLANAINRLLYELIIRCTKNQAEGPRNSYDAGVIGYGSRIVALGGPLAGRDLVPIREVADHPARVGIAPAQGGGRRRRSSRGNGQVRPLVQSNGQRWHAHGAGAAPGARSWSRGCRRIPPRFRLLSLTSPTAKPPTAILVRWQKPCARWPLRMATCCSFNLHLSAHPGAPVLYPDSEASLPDEFAQQL